MSLTIVPERTIRDHLLQERKRPGTHVDITNRTQQIGLLDAHLFRSRSRLSRRADSLITRIPYVGPVRAQPELRVLWPPPMGST